VFSGDVLMKSLICFSIQAAGFLCWSSDFILIMIKQCQLQNVYLLVYQLLIPFKIKVVVKIRCMALQAEVLINRRGCIFLLRGT